MLQSAFTIFSLGSEEQENFSLVFVRSRSILIALLLVLLTGAVIFAQESPEASPTPAQPDPEQAAEAVEKSRNGDPTAEQVAETSIMIYGNGGGRILLNQIRKTAVERGKIKVANAENKLESATYQRYMIRGEEPPSMKIRIEMNYPTAKYSLVSTGEKIFGIFNGETFVPLDSASKAFENRTVHGLDALFRYKELGSTLSLAGRDKHMGVEYYLLDITDKKNRKTRFYVSVKTFRVMMLDYESDGVKYRRKFYDHNLAQGTLVPFRTVLYAGDKVVEEIDIGTVTFGQKVDDGLFAER